VGVDVADPPGVRVRLPGLKLAVNPRGETDVERLIVPAKPARLFTVTVAVPELPTWIIAELELDEIVKSPTPTVMVAVWDSGPLAAVTVTV